MVSVSQPRRQPHLLDGILGLMAAHGTYRLDTTQFSTRQLLAPTCEDRALVRALAEGLTALRIDSSTWAVTSGSQAGTAYTVRQWTTGRLSCSCECGKSGGTTCKHRALVAHELSKQPAATAKPICDINVTLPAKPATAKPITSIADLYD